MLSCISSVSTARDALLVCLYASALPRGLSWLPTSSLAAPGKGYQGRKATLAAVQHNRYQHRVRPKPYARRTSSTRCPCAPMLSACLTKSGFVRSMPKLAMFMPACFHLIICGAHERFPCQGPTTRLVRLPSLHHASLTCSIRVRHAGATTRENALEHAHMRTPRDGAWHAHPLCMSLSRATIMCSFSFTHLDQLIAFVDMDRPWLCGGLGGPHSIRVVV